jgi:hypothetical protein
MKNSRPATAPGGGVKTPAVSSNPTKHPVPGKIKNKKGRPEIADPDGPDVYVDHCRFVLSSLKQMFERVASHDAKSVRVARDALETLFILALYELLALALDNKNRARKWAGKLLAYVDAVIEENREKLSESNETYQRERRQLGKPVRSAVWFPESPLYHALHRELDHCFFYRRELRWSPFQPTWKAEEYQCLMKLRPLSLKSFPRWEKELWPLLNKHNPDLLPKLRRTAKRQQIVPVHSDGVTKRLLKPLNLTWKLLRPQFRRHLKSIASRYG